jgi:hypothetical protein
VATARCSGALFCEQRPVGVCYLEISGCCEDCTEYRTADGFVSIAGNMSVRAETRP